MTQQWPEEAMFFRPINPKHFSESGPTSEAFIPFPKDKGGLSVDDGQLITAGQSWERATKVCGLNSCGTWGVSKHDVETVSSLEIKPDPQLCNKAHCLVSACLPHLFDGLRGGLKLIAPVKQGHTGSRIDPHAPASASF